MFVEQVEVQTAKLVEIIRSDGGGEYSSKAFKAYLESKGIRHEKTNAYTPQWDVRQIIVDLFEYR